MDNLIATIILLLILLIVVFWFIIYLPEVYLSIVRKMPPFVSSEKKVYQIIKSYLVKYFSGRQIKIIELGCGNAAGLRYLTEENNWIGFGYELAWRPYLWALLANKIKKSSNVQLYNQDMFEADLSGADVVYVYLFKETNLLLEDKLIRELKPGTLVISYAFPFPNIPLLEDMKLDKLRHKELHIYRIA